MSKVADGSASKAVQAKPMKRGCRNSVQIGGFSVVHPRNIPRSCFQLSTVTTAYDSQTFLGAQLHVCTPFLAKTIEDGSRIGPLRAKALLSFVLNFLATADLPRPVRSAPLSLQSTQNFHFTTFNTSPPIPVLASDRISMPP